MKAVVGNLGPFTDTIMRESILPGGDILQTTVKREVRLSPSVDSFEPKMLTRETPIKEERFRKRTWGPFRWWERIANTNSDKFKRSHDVPKGAGQTPAANKETP